MDIEDFGFTYPGSTEPSLSGISASVRRGEFVCLTGDSGCGKSTLLMGIMGLLPRGSRLGTIRVAPSAAAGSAPAAGIVFQTAESQILCSTVAEEIAFGPENFCVPADEIALRVREGLHEVGLTGEERRSVERFSAGQKQRLAVASVLSMRPGLLLLDEPTSQLDVQGKEELVAVFTELKRRGHTIVMAEHDPRPFDGLVDRYLKLERGRLVGSDRVPPDPVRYRPKAFLLPYSSSLYGTRPVLDVQGVELSYPETGAVLKKAQLRVSRGERVHLFGRNGAGKSSLLRCLAGLMTPDAGRVWVAGKESPRPGDLRGQVGVLFQNPARQLFAETVREEVAFTLERLAYPVEEVDRIVAEALSFCGIAHLAERAPLTLSFGEQHRVALAAVVAPRPALLLLDEPFAGLDFPQRLSLLAILARMPIRYGTTVFIASHDELPDRRWADRSLTLQGGVIAETAP
ncbi:ABC transporter ATP-binding protein [Geomonas oryzisoli]|uniref:ABC transporter ATP-binding protein n=1 Tax=Geomonas oryzisoli TaxID=2847992 RepID=UPI001EF1583B|nr:ABC transporter ATP-binding protein [Geomonas oryzisoli]